MSNSQFIIGQRIGRLGNQICLLANLLACHQATGIGFCHPVLGDYGKYFKGTAHDFLVRFPLVRHRTFGGFALRSTAYAAVRGLHKLGVLARSGTSSVVTMDWAEELDLADVAIQERVRKCGNLWLMGGWLFRHREITPAFFDMAKEFFQLTEPYKRRVKGFVNAARKNAKILIGVHIRQTDFKTHVNGKYFFSTPEYLYIMTQAAQIFDRHEVAFLVVSDEPKSREDFPGLSCSFGSGIPIEDMYCLGGCDYIISAAISSFSMWPSFLYRIPSYRITDASKRITPADFTIHNGMWDLVTA